jgi:hypothetical protein
MDLTKYYIVKNGEKIGPFSLTELHNQYINNDTLVWYHGLENWVKAETIEKLSEVLEQTPPPIPPTILNITQKIQIDSPIDVNFKKTRKNNQEKTEIQRTYVKRTLAEMGSLVIILIIAFLVGFIVNQGYYLSNKPQLVSEENQYLFNCELQKRMAENSMTITYGEIYSKYLGDSKFDKEITSMYELEDINATRISILKKEAKTVSYYVFYILLSLILSVRYIRILFKWLNTEKN